MRPLFAQLDFQLDKWFQKHQSQESNDECKHRFLVLKSILARFFYLQQMYYQIMLQNILNIRI